MVAAVCLFVFSYGVPMLFPVAQVFLTIILMGTILDGLVIFNKKDPVAACRILPDRLSNGDQNTVEIRLQSKLLYPIRTRIIDELPDQLQVRNFSLQVTLYPQEECIKTYQVRPTARGEYVFHWINLYFKTPLALVVRRQSVRAEKAVKVLPSFLQLRQYELLAYSNRLSESGGRKIRKLGHSLEFEQIKEYVRGDDVRTINWKATGRSGGSLMVNKYIDEKSQQVYCIIDQGRVMKMPFEGMTLLDYAINATLMLSRVALIKQDKAGLVVFSDQVNGFLPADHKAIQMTSILDGLYRLETKFPDSDFEKLHTLVSARIMQRSLIVLFTNFESLSGLHRQLPYLRSIAKSHLLLVVFFENTALAQITKLKVKRVEDVYTSTIAAKFAFEKRLIVKALQQHGIASILTTPQRLTANAVNKYLEIKARQAI